MCAWCQRGYTGIPVSLRRPYISFDECLKFVERYGDQIVKVLVNAVNALEICTELMLCDAKTVIGEFCEII